MSGFARSVSNDMSISARSASAVLTVHTVSVQYFEIYLDIINSLPGHAMMRDALCLIWFCERRAET
jgi:hypothetical protein